MDEREESRNRWPSLPERVALIFEWLDKHNGGWVHIFWQSWVRLSEMRGAEVAASLAYYALFSLFPLTLFLASLLGFFFQGEVAYTRALAFIRAVFPFSGELLDQELRDVFGQRGTFGILGILGLLWAASGFFNVLARSINLAWPKVKLRGFVQSRLVALGMLGGIVLLLLISVLASTLISLMPVVLEMIGANAALVESQAWLIGLRLATIVITYLIFTAMYRWVPNKVVSWKPALTGALFSTVVWEVARQLFTLYLSSGLARFQFIYGSLGALIALMIWIYFSSFIALYGAYLVATLDLMKDQKPVSTPAQTEHEARTAKGIRG